MKVFVSGAGGFIGSKVVRALALAGHRVRAHLGAPGDPVVPAPVDVESLWFEIGDEAALGDAVRDVDAVVHLAGPAAVAPSFGDPAGYARAHVAGTANVVAAMERAHVAHLLYVSSAEVYGRPECDPVTEDAPLAPRSPYGVAKAGAELVVSSALRRGGLARAVVLRPFSVYCPGQRANSLLAAILRQTEAQSEILVDDVRPVRDYVFVDDVVAAISRALGGSTAGIIVANIAGGAGVSVADLAMAAAAAAGRDLPVRERGATRPAGAEISRLVADITRARQEFGWQPAVTLAEGLRRTIAHMAPA